MAILRDWLCFVKYSVHDHSSLQDATAHAVRRRPPRRPAATLPSARARPLDAVAAIFVGITGDALLHDGGWPRLRLWIALVASARRPRLARRPADASRDGCLARRRGGVRLALAWRNSETLQAFDVLATLGCLGMAAVSVRDPAPPSSPPAARDVRRRSTSALGIVRGPFVVSVKQFGAETGRIARPSAAAHCAPR